MDKSNEIKDDEGSPMMVTTSRDPRRWGLPIGAVQLNPKNLQAFRTLLEKQILKEKIRFRGVERISENQILVHVPPRVASSLDEGQLNDFLTSINATYKPQVRRSPPLPKVAYSDDSEDSFSFVELFAGIGGFRLGLEQINGVSLLASELSPWAAQIYRSNFQDSTIDCLVEGDVLDLDLKDFSPYTMLTAGFPCQPFSNRGLQQGLNDVKGGQLYLELNRILAQTQPPCFIFENVAQIVVLDGGSRSARRQGEPSTFTMGRVMERILASFAACGYQVDWQVVNSRHFLPQYRERVYIVGTRNDLQCEAFNWNNVLPVKPSTATVRDILEPLDAPAVMESQLSPSQWQKVQSLHLQRNTSPLVDGSICLDGKAPTLISQYHRVGSLSTKFIFEQLDGTRCDGVGENRPPRFLTPRECCRIMGFPEDFQISDDTAHFYQGIGNAVTPPVIAAVGAELMRLLRC